MGDPPRADGPDRKPARHVCPICGRDAVRAPKGDPRHNPAFPFCSPSCKLVDLGRWLDGGYVIPEPLTDGDPEDRE